MLVKVAFTVILFAALASGSVEYKNVARKDKYDYIVVGAGSAGAALANRLSEDAGTSVLLLEAGGQPPELSEIPIFAAELQKDPMEWNNVTEVQKKSCLANKGVCGWSRAKTLGGCSTHNFMCYVRGNPEDFNNWEKLGATGWGYKDVLPYFIKMENHTDPEIKEDKDYHGTEGYQTVSSVIYKTKIGDAFMEALASLKHQEIDYNGASQKGYSRLQVSQREGLRCSTEKAYLRPVVDRPNLDILTGAFVLRVGFDDQKKVKNVSFDHKSTSKVIQVTKEVILSAGALSSPKILMHSGIGPKESLDKFQIPVIQDLPGVGQNLQDHILVVHLNYLINEKAGIVMPDDDNNETRKQLSDHQGPLTSPAMTEIAAFLSSKLNENKEWPDLMVVPGSAPIFSPIPLDWNHKNSTTCSFFLARPKSRGTIKLLSDDPYQDPSVNPNYFSDDEDMKRNVDGVKVCMEIMKTPALQKFEPKLNPLVVPGCETFEKDSDEYIECSIGRFATGGFHFVGSCKMGDPSDKLTVVDPQLRVIGVTGLRVADASVIPAITTGNTNAPSIMIGEKAADIIKKSA